MSTDRWRPEAEKIAAVIHEINPYAPDFRERAVDAILRLVERVQQETREEVSAEQDRYVPIPGRVVPGAVAASPALVERVACPCGFGDEPWHWPCGGICVVGMQTKVGERQQENDR